MILERCPGTQQRGLIRGKPRPAAPAAAPRPAAQPSALGWTGGGARPRRPPALRGFGVKRPKPAAPGKEASETRGPGGAAPGAQSAAPCFLRPSGGRLLRAGAGSSRSRRAPEGAGAGRAAASGRAGLGLGPALLAGQGAVSAGGLENKTVQGLFVFKQRFWVFAKHPLSRTARTREILDGQRCRAGRK